MLALISRADAQVQYTKSLYIENFPQLILGNTQREDHLLSFAQSRGFNSLVLYNIQEIFSIRVGPPAGILTSTTPLHDFIVKARTQYGIEEIGVTYGANWDHEPGSYPQSKIVQTTPFGFESAPTSGITNFSQIENSISAVTLPFSVMDLDQNTTNQIFVSSNGYIALGTSISDACASCSTAVYIPDPSPDSPKNIIAGLWDTYAFTGSSIFRHYINGIAPNRVAVFEWRNVRFKNATANDLANFQIKLFEDHHFEIHIEEGSNNPDVNSRQTLGIQNSDGTVQVSPESGAWPHTWRDRYYPSTQDAAWTFKPKERFDFIDEHVKYYNNEPTTTADGRIDAISLEFEFWNGHVDFKWEAVQHWKHALKRTHDLMSTSAVPCKTIPYVNRFRPYIHKSNSNYVIDLDAFYNYIDTYSDVVMIVYYFSDIYLKETGQPSNFGNIDGADGQRLEGFAKNTKPTKIRIILNGEHWFFGGSYLHKLEGHTWTENGVQHSYDENYFGNTLPEDKALEEFEIGLTHLNPYRSSSVFPCGNSSNSLSCTMSPPWGTNPSGNILEGAIWFRYFHMPEADFLMQGPSNRNVSLFSSYLVQSSDILSTLPSTHTTSFDFSKNKWYKWSRNSLGHNQYMDMSVKLNCNLTNGSSTITTTSTSGLSVGMYLFTDVNRFDDGTTITSIVNATTFTVSTAAKMSTTHMLSFTTPTIYVPAPRLFRTDSYIHQNGLTSVNNYNIRWVRNRMNLTTTAITEPYPHSHHFSVLNIYPSRCPDYNNGSAEVSLESVQSGDPIPQAIVSWKKPDGPLNSTGTPVNLPYTIDSLDDGIWFLTLNYSTDSISDTLYIHRPSDLKP